MHTVAPAKSLTISITVILISILLLSNVSGNDLDTRNDPPLTPSIPDGPTIGYRNIEYEYSSNTTDPDGDQLYYLWEWGDNSTPVWYGPYYSGQTSNISHEWTELGTYQIRVKAKDNNNVESDWSEPLNVSIIGQTLYVGGSGPGNYSSIQSAIDASSSGDTVYVYNGTYYENVVVDKSLILVGENRNSTTINAGWNGNAVRINADWVNISDFKIKNTGDIGYEAGVYTTSNNNNISDNLILGCSNGIFLKWGFYNNTVYRNTIINNGEGIYLCSPTSKILKNTISSNGNGIQLTSGNNLISSNDISDNFLGIDFLSTCNNNIILNNTFNSNIGGMFIYGTNNHILNNNFSNCGMLIVGERNNVSNNYVNEKPVIYLENKSDIIIDSDTGQIIIINCKDITINNQTLSNTTVGIELYKSNNCTIFNNSISNNVYPCWGIMLLWSNNTIVLNNSIKHIHEAIYLEKTNGNIIRENTVSECGGVGIYLNWDTINTIIEDNIIFSCDKAIEFYDSSNNTIRYNNIINNEKGIWVRSSSNNNKFYLNNLINSSLYHARDEGNNEWFNEFTSLGNYWDDYTGMDMNGDGIGDTPYDIPGDSNQDYYPLMNPYNYELLNPDIIYIDDDFNLSIFGWQYDHFDVIQDGIDAVAENGIVHVFNGIYYENVVVNKTIDLVGENKNSTIIDGGGNGISVNISADWVNINGFSIRNSGYIAGIFVIANYSNISISYNNIYNNNNGILLAFINNSTIHHNNISFNNNDGIYLWDSYSNKIDNNIIINNTNEGIGFTGSCYNIINGNIITSNDNDGIGISASCNNNNLTNNTIISNNDDGILISSSSKNNYVFNNTIASNNDDGIYIVGSGNSNQVISNIISLNNGDGIELSYSNNNSITGNDISSNIHNGIKLTYSSDNNLIYHNNLINNTLNGYDECNNFWYNSTFQEGNYYDDYYGNDADGDGIGDIPYNISAGSNQDLYPFIEEDGWLKSIDVDQDVWARGFPIRHALDGDWAGAQSFKTSDESLTRVDVLLRRFGTPEFNLTLEVRENSPDGIFIESFEFQPDVVDVNWGWFNLDLIDINTTSGTDYFIVIPPAPSGVTTSFGYEWGYAFGNQYDDGSFWFTRDGGGLWRDLPTMYEFCFRTYGYL